MFDGRVMGREKRERQRTSMCWCEMDRRGDDVDYNNSGDGRDLSFGGTRSQMAHRFIGCGGVDRQGDEHRGRD